MKSIYYSLFLLVLNFLVFSCNQNDDDPGAGPIEAGPNLADLRATINQTTANDIILPAYEKFQVQITTLDQAVQDFTTNPSTELLEVTRNALKESWLEWQNVAIYLFGPSENVALRKSMNTYPTNTSKIEDNILNQNYILSSIDNQAAIGLPAIDYLLNGLSTDEASIVGLFLDNEKRGTYLKELASDLKTRVDKTVSGWASSGDNYAATYSNANGTDIGSSLGILMNAIDLHYQRFLRDGKVAIPAGIRSAGVPRPKATEAYYGGYSVDLLVAGLQAYQRLLEGIGQDEINREGIFDYLLALDEGMLAEQIKGQLESAIVAAAKLSDPLSQNIEEDLDQVTEVFLEMQKVVPLLKADMASKMGIIITNTDNDGD